MFLYCRRSVTPSLIKDLQIKIDNDKDVEFCETDVHIAAVLLNCLGKE